MCGECLIPPRTNVDISKVTDKKRVDLASISDLVDYFEAYFPEKCFLKYLNIQRHVLKRVVSNAKIKIA